MRGHVLEDLIQQILLNLPVKSLLRLMSVCTSWQSLVKSPSFISNHLSRTNCRQQQQLLLLGCWVDNDCGAHTEWQYSLHVDGDEFKDYRKLINLPFQTIPIWGSSKTVGCCNGLVCLKKTDIRAANISDSYNLWNPTLGKLFPVPKSNLVDKFDAIVDGTVDGGKNGAYTRTLEGFGFDSSTQNYKILRIVQVFVNDSYGDDSFLVGGWIDIYSYNSDSWKDITPAEDVDFRIELEYFCQHQIPFARRFSYFLGHDATGPILWQFDMASEAFREIVLPEEMAEYPRFPHLESLRSYGDSSIAIYECCTSDNGITGFYIWLMQENSEGESRSWTKKFVVVEEEPKKFIRPPLLVRKNGEPIMEKPCRGIFSDNPHRQQCHFLCKEGYRAFVNYYVESLALLNIEKETTDSEFESAFVNVDCDTKNEAKVGDSIIDADVVPFFILECKWC